MIFSKDCIFQWRRLIFICVALFPLQLESASLEVGQNIITGSITGVVKNRWVKFTRYPTIVYIEKVSSGTYRAPQRSLIMDQINRKFRPRLLPVIAGTTVDFLNSDDTEHDVYSPSAEQYDLGEFRPGQARSHTFDKVGVYRQFCRAHPKMTGSVVVLQNPFYAITNGVGAFTMNNVPVGIWKMKVFNERMDPANLGKGVVVMVGANRTAKIVIEP